MTHFRVLNNDQIPLTTTLNVKTIHFCQAQVQVQVPGPEGPRTKDQRPGPGLYTKFGLPPTTHHHPVNFSLEIITPNHYCMTYNYVLAKFGHVHLAFRVELRRLTWFVEVYRLLGQIWPYFIMVHPAFT